MLSNGTRGRIVSIDAETRELLVLTRRGALRLPAAYADARWIGPARGSIDPVKAVLAAAARMELNLTTADDECAATGKYWEDQFHQAAREDALRQKLGLQPAGSAIAQAIQDTKNPSKAAPHPTDPQGEPAPEDVPPATPKGPDESAASALAQLRRMASSAAHEAALDARMVA